MITMTNSYSNNNSNINNGNGNNSYSNNYLIQTVPTMTESFDQLIDQPQHHHNNNHHNHSNSHHEYLNSSGNGCTSALQQLHINSNNQYHHEQQQYSYNNYSSYPQHNEYSIKLQPYGSSYVDCIDQSTSYYDNNNNQQESYQQQPSPSQCIDDNGIPHYINNIYNPSNNSTPPSTSSSITQPEQSCNSIQIVNNKKRQLDDSSSIYLIQSYQSSSSSTQSQSSPPLQQPQSQYCPNSPSSTSSISSNNNLYYPNNNNYKSSQPSQPSSSTSSPPPIIYTTYEASDEEMEEQFKEFLTPSILNLLDSNHKETLLSLVNDYLYEVIPLKTLLVELREIQLQTNSTGSGSSNNVNGTITQQQSFLNNLIELFLIIDNSSNIMVNYLKENGISDDEIKIVDKKRLSILLSDFENGLRGKDKTTLKKTTSRGLRNPPNKWTKEESSKLITLVHENGDKQWKKIALQIGGGKTGAQCAQHWKRVLCPAIRKGSWDEDEEAKLFTLVEKHGQSWKNVASEIRTRTDIQCRYQYFKSCMSREVAWSMKEDEILAKKVVEYKQDQSSQKEISWMDLSKSMARARQTKIPRTALECKIRWSIISIGINQLIPMCFSPSSSHDQISQNF